VDGGTLSDRAPRRHGSPSHQDRTQKGDPSRGCRANAKGKVERLHKPMRAEFFADADRVFATIGELQAALDGWVDRYNTTSRFLELVDLSCDVA
jgi:hypothetical protein